MSGGLILNGGTAENFTETDVSSKGLSSHHVHTTFIEDAWEPEDLVATVQFLATLDERQRLPYILPEAPNYRSQINQDHLFDRTPTPDEIFEDPETVQSDEDVQLEAEEVVLELNSSMSSNENTDTNEPQLNTTETVVNSLTGCAFNDSVSCVSLDSSLNINDNSSAAQTPCSTEERSIIRPSNKPSQIKRVSFGSSKGSMVETLIYDSPLSEHEPTPFGWRANKPHRSASHQFRTTLSPTLLPEETQLLLSGESSGVRSASKVRVTFFESERPLTLPSPEASDAEWEDNMVESPPPQPVTMHQLPSSSYVRQVSTESGVDNPFRPDGDLSREADELLELLKGSGRPISEVLKSRESAVHLENNDAVTASVAAITHSSPEHHAGSPLLSAEDVADGGPARVNSSTCSDSAPDADSCRVATPMATIVAEAPTTPSPLTKATSVAPTGAVEVEHGVVAPETSENQVEHVVIKKKSKCQCCVLQ